MTNNNEDPVTVTSLTLHPLTSTYCRPTAGICSRASANLQRVGSPSPCCCSHATICTTPIPFLEHTSLLPCLIPGSNMWNKKAEVWTTLPKAANFDCFGVYQSTAWSHSILLMLSVHTLGNPALTQNQASKELWERRTMILLSHKKEEIEVQRGQVTCQKSYSQWLMKMKIWI